MTEADEILLNLVNASGFLFQLRIEQEVEAAKSSHNERWDVLAREHRWVDPLEGKEGFIDLILENDILKMVVECKRTTEASWIFLIPNNQSKTNRARLLWTYEGPVESDTIRRKIYEWHDFRTKLISYESSFCIVRGQGEKDTPMLERLSSSLLRSVEGLANEEFEFTGEKNGLRHLYFPVIITNTRLFVCQFDISDIDISTGQLAKGGFTEVQSVRFRKSLSSSAPGRKRSNLTNAALANERTVFVVNSNNMGYFLANMDLPYKINVPWPWEGLRQS